MPLSNGCGHKVGVIGTINRDTIVNSDGSVVNSWGGILYNIKFLNDFTNLTIYPAVNVGADCQQEISSILNCFKNIDPRFIKVVAPKSNHCFLNYSDQSAKTEILKGGVPPLKYRDISGLLSCDLVLVNFISGRDVGLRALEKFRHEYSGMIYIDLHSLTLGRRQSSDGVRRFLRRPKLWRRYAACADILQINRVEFELLSRRKFSTNNAIQFFERLDKRTKYLIVTLGNDGCLIVKSHDQPEVVHLPVEPVAHIYDTTGCGDIFSAGFIGEYLTSGDPIASVQNANRLAADRCRLRKRMF